MALVEDTDC
ncbi:Protein of unknown function [Bacillus wiedmannii]|nr:Protein of unknown function [Bacillus wiedmannii]